MNRNTNTESKPMKVPRFNLVFTIGAVSLAVITTVIATTRAKTHSSVTGKVNLIHTPNGGIQPQALTDERGALHMIYFVGEPSAGDIYYVRRERGKADFSSPIRVNSQPGSAIAVGTIRGAHLSIGRNGRIHISWNGSNKAAPRGPENSEPMLYARLNDAKNAFEPQRNLMQSGRALDGGGSVAADKEGNVYVVWHAGSEEKGEEHRRVRIAASTDDGKTFTPETPAGKEETGVCSC